MKIDIVYTWVDGSDPKWIKRKKEKLNEVGKVLPDSNSESRFKDNQELRYSLRSIHKFAPWVNKIFIVTDNQCPSWLNTTHSKIELIDHKEIFHDKSVLPTFSARVIESQLHHIENLSEHFIYFNDDMFLGRDSKPEHFFINENTCRVFVSEIIAAPSRKSFNINLRVAENRNDHQHAIVNTRKLVRKRFDKSVYYNIRHGAKALLKSVLYNLEKEFSEELAETLNNNFRTENDILMLHLFEYYCLINGIGKPKYLKTVKPGFFSRLIETINRHYSFGYINLHDNNVAEKLNIIQQTHPFMICLNHTPRTPEKNLGLIRKFFSNYFPDKSPFEKD